jgi:hypothetical protein
MAENGNAVEKPGIPCIILTSGADKATACDAFISQEKTHFVALNWAE